MDSAETETRRIAELLMRSRNPGRSISDLAQMGQWEFLWAFFEMFFISRNPTMAVVIPESEDHLLEVYPFEVTDIATRKAVLKEEHDWGILQGKVARGIIHGKAALTGWNLLRFAEKWIGSPSLGGWAEMKKLQLLNKAAFEDEAVSQAFGEDAVRDINQKSIDKTRLWVKEKRALIEEAYRTHSLVPLLDICNFEPPFWAYGTLFESYLMEPPSFFPKETWLVDDQPSSKAEKQASREGELLLKIIDGEFFIAHQEITLMSDEHKVLSYLAEQKNTGVPVCPAIQICEVCNLRSDGGSRINDGLTATNRIKPIISAIRKKLRGSRSRLSTHKIIMNHPTTGSYELLLNIEVR